MLSTILHSYVQYGDKFLLWNMTFPSGKIYQVNMVFPLCLFVVDIQGAHKLVGMFDSYSQVERPCISCDCTFDNLDNFRVQCNAIIHDDMRNAIINKSKDELKQYSQHKLPENAFFNVSTGGWKYGIWGLCPAEILHQLYEGLIKYALDYFFQNLFTDASRDRLEKDVAKIIKCCKNQSDRSFPKATYTSGICSTAKMKGKEKFASLFYLSLYLSTTISKDVYKGLNKSVQRNKLLKWRDLFDKTLFLHDWLMQEEHSIIDVGEKAIKIKEYFKLYKTIVKREEGNGLKIPKMHELLHVCRDILRHGPPMNYDTCPTESNHRPMKALSHNTQRIKSRFEFQTASRLYEENIITTSFEKSVKDIRSMHKISSSHSKIDKKSSHKYFVTYDRDTKKIHFQNTLDRDDDIENSNLKDNNTENLYAKLAPFIKTHIFEKLTVDHLPCYSIYKRKNLIFYGETTKKRKNITNLSWAQFLWQFDDGREDVVPGLCLLFIDLCNVSYKETCELEDRYENEIYVLIQSLSKKPPDNPGNLAQPCSVLEGYFLVSVDTIHDACYIIPDIGNVDTKNLLYINSRTTWAENF